MRKSILALASSSVLLAGCASSGTQTASMEDPWEGFNRKVFAFNMRVDRVLLEPVAKGYRVVTTDEMRDGVSNALANLKEPVTAANQILQGEFAGAGETVGRFAMNSTLGVAGFVDAAGHFGHERKKEDFGQTLAVWGVPSGPYLMLPLLGPSSPRAVVGQGVDSVFKPMTWVEFDGDDLFQAGKTTVGVVSAREDAIEAAEDLRNQIDPYIAMRQFYVKSQEGALRNGELQDDLFEDLPDFDEY